MKTTDGVYTGFIIRDEKDILELKHMIKNYKPISHNDIAFLFRKLEKKGNRHLVIFFEKHIIGKGVSQNPQVSTSQPEKKAKKKSIDKEVYQTKTYKASDFNFFHKMIKVREYTLKTERAFVIPKSILQKIQAEFTIKILPDKTFYFENQGLTNLLYLVERYCFSYLDTVCETWFIDKMHSPQKDVMRDLRFGFSDFAFNEKNGRYELKEDAIKYIPLNVEYLRYNFMDFVNRVSNIPGIYKSKYISKYPYAKKIKEFNKEFIASFAGILRKYLYYTEKDLEVSKWYYNQYSPTMVVRFKLVDEDENVDDWIVCPSFSYSQNIELEFKYVPKGSLYDFGEEAISTIETIIESLKEDGAHDLFKACLESIKTKHTVEYETDRYFSNFSTYSSFDTKCKYKINNPLLDISDNHYRLGHPKVEEYGYKLENGIIHKIAYFRDLNNMFSQDLLSGKCVDCYLLVNDEYIALYALDYSKSTYIFKVKEGYIDVAMFLIWAYFSSSLYNKREGKYIRIERLFSYFGIEYYNNMGSPISKNEEGLYQFLLHNCFYRNIKY